MLPTVLPEHARPLTAEQRARYDGGNLRRQVGEDLPAAFVVTGEGLVKLVSGEPGGDTIVWEQQTISSSAGTRVVRLRPIDLGPRLLARGWILLRDAYAQDSRKAMNRLDRKTGDPAGYVRFLEAQEQIRLGKAKSQDTPDPLAQRFALESKSGGMTRRYIPDSMYPELVLQRRRQAAEAEVDFFAEVEDL